MTHMRARSDREDAGAFDCDGRLIDGNTSFSSDVNWEVFTCEKCLATVFTVEGRVHWWNHHGEPSDARRQRQEQMAAEREHV